VRRTLEVIEEFIKDIYGSTFLGGKLDDRISRIEEIMRAYQVLQKGKGIREEQADFSKDFMENVLPLLEVAVQWKYLKQSGKISNEFMEQCRRRMRASGSNFRGAMFELDMATRCLLSNWEVYFPETSIKNIKTIDLVVKKTEEEVVALECVSKRGTGVIDIQKIEENIQKKKDKFKPENLQLLNMQFAKKLIVIDVTRPDYKRPAVVREISKIGNMPYIDGIILTWREDVIDKNGHSIRIKYKCRGEIPDEYFSVTWAIEIRKRPHGLVFFFRKYIEPESSHGAWGPEEKLR